MPKYISLYSAPASEAPPKAKSLPLQLMTRRNSAASLCPSPPPPTRHKKLIQNHPKPIPLRRRRDLCEEFYAAHGREEFAEGAVVKSYQGEQLATFLVEARGRLHGECFYGQIFEEVGVRAPNTRGGALPRESKGPPLVWGEAASLLAAAFGGEDTAWLWGFECF